MAVVEEGKIFGRGAIWRDFVSGRELSVSMSVILNACWRSLRGIVGLLFHIVLPM